ncbi:Rrf2 family transcriptional regulator [Ahrensia sp. R2A130]|uniref:Rrf2 family transcriptional regulator n=1 Tax=Ahrensia sp. R2A130 TaxID=744979 RepID=UPI0001E0A48B|nr:Rrf2 family transcriptional regulator [Ahrensia sp. R2A130]EFL88618.1 protein Aau3 [Ahrensia sp. R2A130]
MQITKQTNYALRMLMYCAAHEGSVRLSDVATFYGLSQSFMHKVLQTTSKAGFVKTMRGRSGGLMLARPPEEITVGEVVRAVEDRFEMAECFREDTTCPLEQSCGLNGAFHEALDAFLTVLDKHTIADITNERANINVLATLEAMTRLPLDNDSAFAKQ